jgi:uncharacterized protein YqfA (UPF0365 family)
MSFAPLALIFLLIIVFFVLFVWLIPVRLWIAAWSSGAGVGFGELIGMRLRRVAPGAVVTHASLRSKQVSTRRRISSNLTTSPGATFSAW